MLVGANEYAALAGTLKVFAQHLEYDGGDLPDLPVAETLTALWKYRKARG